MAVDSIKNRKANDYEEANVLSKVLFCWMLPLFYKGYRRDLKLEDISHAPSKYRSKHLGDKLEWMWFLEEEDAKIHNRKPSLRRVLVKTYIWKFLPHAILLLVASLILRSIQPIVLRIVLQFFEKDNEMARQEAQIYGLILVLITLFSCIITRHGLRLGQEFGMSLKIACGSLIYRKILRMDIETLKGTSRGKVINLLSNDLSRFDMCFVHTPFLLIAPLQVFLVMYLTYNQIGWFAFIGMGTMIIQTIPVNAYFIRLTAKFRLAIAQMTDQRLEIMTEIINGIKVIKMYAWEKPFHDLVAIIRTKEIMNIQKTCYLKALFSSLLIFTPRSSLYFTLLTYSIMGNAVKAYMVYAFQQFLSNVNTSISFYLSNSISMLSESLVAIDRMEEFLSMGERVDLHIRVKNWRERGERIASVNDKYNKFLNGGIVNQFFRTDTHEKSIEDLLTCTGIALDLNQVTASWNSESSSFKLSNITMRIISGELCHVVGGVGSGKSSLLHLLLGEMKTTSGHFTVNGKISFCSQDSWLFMDSIRENILFGSAYDATRYQEVIEVCALEDDFKQIPRGDMALVGERGLSLSGGQRARISLARTIYRKADIYLLDDPLSAVDISVVRHLFKKCINGFLKNSTRILVTHHLQFLRNADLVVVLNNGIIEKIGSHEEIVSSTEISVKLLSVTNDQNHDNITSDKSQSEIFNQDENNDFTDDEVGEVLQEEEQGQTEKFKKILSKYIRAGNSWLYFSLVVVFLLLGQLVSSCCDYWVFYWTSNVSEYGASININSTGNDINSKLGPLSTLQYLYVYSGFAFGCVAVAIVQNALFFNLCIKSSTGLHNKMFGTMLRATPRFFDKNPSGRILNRFSKDLGQIDEQLPRTTLNTIQICLAEIGSIILVTMSRPWIILPICLLWIILGLIVKVYLRTSQTIKRIEGVMKSPVLSHVNSTLHGVTTIRSSESEAKWIQDYDEVQDIHTSTCVQVISGNTTLGCWLDFLSSLYILVIVFIFLGIDTGVPSAYIGLVISEAFDFARSIQFGIRQGTDVMALTTNIERILQYTKIETEYDSEKKGIDKQKGWPNKGELQIKINNMRYDIDKSPVLQDLNIDIKSGWKVGVVGRTGAGKTSLISALFRLAYIDGKIILDNIETSSIAIQQLRSSISIIPQEPVLFSASMRFNLDPFNTSDDVTLWKALEAVDLKDTIQSLDQKIAQGGSNFSVGQRQLICLARAIIKHNKILVLDEATANVDEQTDSFIQQTIRMRFKNCTVITIAHRLNTIMDSDMILVMNYGKAVEFDHPYNLLKNPVSLFSNMVRRTGSQTSEYLYSVAKNNYEKNNSNLNISN